MLEESAVTRGKLMSVVAALAVAIVGVGAEAAELNTLRDLKVVQTGSGAQVVVAGTRAPTFTVFRLSGPERCENDVPIRENEYPPSRDTTVDPPGHL